MSLLKTLLLVPEYRVSELVGKSRGGCWSGSWYFTRFLTDCDSHHISFITIHFSNTPQFIDPGALEASKQKLGCFCPYRHLQSGGTLLGIAGRNFWISDDCLVGWLLSLPFRAYLKYRKRGGIK